MNRRKTIRLVKELMADRIAGVLRNVHDENYWRTDATGVCIDDPAAVQFGVMVYYDDCPGGEYTQFEVYIRETQG